MKKIIAILMTVMTMTIGTNVFAANVCLSASPISSTAVEEGGNLAFVLNYTNDINKITLTADDIELSGFEGKKEIYQCGNERIVIVSDIKSTNTNAKKRIKIKSGTAYSSDNKEANAIATQSFSIK